MVRVMFTGLSGLVTHQKMMDVVSNNNANVNTVGFKAGRATFANTFAQNVAGALRANAESRLGGRNPFQVGLGVRLAATDINMNPGQMQTTLRDLDVAIQGNGFFIVGEDDRQFLTRNGNFDVDVITVANPDYDPTDPESPETISQMHHLHMGGHNVFGFDSAWNAETGRYEILRDGEITPIQFLGGKEVYNARPTTRTSIQGNLDPASAGIEVPVYVYDSEGTRHGANVIFENSHGRWTYRVTGEGELYFSPVPPADEPFEGPFGHIPFDITGETDFEGVSLYVTGIPGVTSMYFNFSDLRQTSGNTSVSATDTDGNPPGRLTRISVNPDSTISGYYSNGRDRLLWQIALAHIPNPMGLERHGDGLFGLSTTSGGINPETGELFIVENPVVASGTLEMSNVNLGQVMVDMLTAQRGFQVNSTLVTTADEMIQTARDLKR